MPVGPKDLAGLAACTTRGRVGSWWSSEDHRTSDSSRQSSSKGVGFKTWTCEPIHSVNRKTPYGPQYEGADLRDKCD